MNDVQIFQNERFGQVRVIEREGQPVIVFKDVAISLDYPESTISNIASMIQHVSDEWKGRYPIPTPGGVQEMWCLTEQGLYFFLARSDKPAALPFQKWLAGDVLPSIRKHGGYLTPAMVEDALLNPDTIIRLATNLKAEREKRLALEAQSAADRPKVIFADAVDASHTSILVGDLAKLLRQNGIEIGQNRLFDWLRNNEYLMKHGESRNMPTQYAMELGLFEIKERTIINPDGSNRLTRTPKITGKGQIYFVNKLKLKSTA
jgi:anti-repressor protein